MTSDRANDHIRVGFTEAHGMAHELLTEPPPGVSYSFVKPVGDAPWYVTSQIKGYLRRYASPEHDLIEAVLTPILTSQPWIYSCECLPAAATFELLGLPVPRVVRIAYLKRLLGHPRCKAIVFWSNAGRATLQSYGGIQDAAILAKTHVVYPAIREVREPVRAAPDQCMLLFSGDFFRKGGVHVVDAFERLRSEYPFVTLRLCCDPEQDFNTPNRSLRDEYVAKVHRVPGVTVGRVRRDELIDDILPRTSVYLLPTYAETFGFALLEAMAFGIPVVATRHFAIPEIVDHDRTGILLDVSAYDVDRMFGGYIVHDIPDGFRAYLTEAVLGALVRLVESPELRRSMGSAGREVARTRFSFAARNARMAAIYREALASAT
jgi:glycosyltransferase involved in cell wall biosynthesis